MWSEEIIQKAKEETEGFSNTSYHSLCEQQKYATVGGSIERRKECLNFCPDELWLALR